MPDATNNFPLTSGIVRSEEEPTFTGTRVRTGIINSSASRRHGPRERKALAEHHGPTGTVGAEAVGRRDAAPARRPVPLS